MGTAGSCFGGGIVASHGVLSGWSIWARSRAAGRGRRGAAAPIPIDADDIAGVVTSARGPEAGVWVIAETTDTPTKFRKIVVTDDRGRYLLPDLPAKATFTIWVRGYGLIDSSPVRSLPGRALALTAVVAPDARTAARVYPANYWYSLIDVPAEKEFPGTGRGRQRHRARDAHAAPLDQPDQGQLQRLSSDGQPGDARDPESARDVRVERGGMGYARPGRAGRPGHEQHGDRPGTPARPRDVRQLDGSDLARRHPAGAASSAGCRAQSRADDVGLGWSGDVRARRADDRQAQPHRQRLRPDLRRRLGQRRIPDRRSAGTLGAGDPDSGARSESAAGQGAEHAGAVAVLGRQAVLVRSRDHQSRGDGRQGARVDVITLPPAREPAGVLRNASIGGPRAAEEQLPAGAVLRPEDAAVQAGEHLLRHAPRPVCRRQGRDAVRQRRLQWCDRLDQHAHPRRDGR